MFSFSMCSIGNLMPALRKSPLSSLMLSSSLFIFEKLSESFSFIFLESSFVEFPPETPCLLCPDMKSVNNFPKPLPTTEVLDSFSSEFFKGTCTSSSAMLANGLRSSSILLWSPFWSPESSASFSTTSSLNDLFFLFSSMIWSMFFLMNDSALSSFLMSAERDTFCTKVFSFFCFFPVGWLCLLHVSFSRTRFALHSI